MPEHNAHFKTLTVARIYAEQGKLDQARKIYRQLLAESPADADLARDLATLEREIEARAATALQGSDIVELAWQGRDLLCRWQVSAKGMEGAQALLGQAPGDLTLRIVGFPRDAESSVHDLSVDSEYGTALIPPPRGASYVAASVGLMDSEGIFASIAHCDMLPT